MAAAASTFYYSPSLVPLNVPGCCSSSVYEHRIRIPHKNRLLQHSNVHKSALVSKSVMAAYACRLFRSRFCATSLLRSKSEVLFPGGAKPANDCLAKFCHTYSSIFGARSSGICRGAGTRSVALAAWKQEILWTEAPLLAVEPAAESLYHVVIDVGDYPEILDGYSTPGQFVQVKVGDSKPVFLAIASPPGKVDGSLEFLIKDVEGATAGILCDLGKGDVVELSQVMGYGFDVSKISHPRDCDAVFIFATGSGISPIRALLEHGLDAHKRSNVTLYYGARNLKRMAYQERFQKWESTGVKVIPVLSRPDDNWTGEKGYVQAAFAKAKDIQNPSNTGAVLCGHKQMAEDVTSILVTDGVSKEKILKNF